MTIAPPEQDSNSSLGNLAPESAPGVAGEVPGNQDTPSQTSQEPSTPSTVDKNATTNSASQGLCSVPAIPGNVAMQSPMQTGMFQNAQLAPAVPARPRLMSPYPNTAGPLRVVDPRFGVPHNYPHHPATHARPNSAPVATGPAPQLAVPHRLYAPSSLQPTNAYHHHQYPNMTSLMPAPTFPQHNLGRSGISSSNATGTNALVNAPFNPRFVPPQYGHGMQPGYYNPAGNAMLAITVQCPLGQPMINNPNAPSVQKPVAYPASYHPGMHTIIPPHHWDFSPQGLFSHRPLFPNGSTITQAQELRMQSGTKNEPQEYQLQSVSVKVEELDATMTNDTRSSVLQQPLRFKGKGRAKRRSSRGVKCRESSSSGIPLPASAGPSTISSGSSPRTGKKRPRVTSCYWDNCGMEVEGDADKLAYTRHLDEVHDFRGLASREMTTCLWVDPDTRERCGKELQIQSMIKHVCEIHLNNLGMDCPMCGSYQARIGNMSRHWTVCAEYHNLGEENQRRLWDEIISGAKGFDWYLKHKRERE